MNDLKTLKDLNDINLCRKKNLRFKRLIRKEAIKQYKAINKKESAWSRQDVLNWIKYFFNITEEDLK